MRGLLKSIPLTFQCLFKDPVNFILFLLPTLVSIILYIGVFVYVYSHSSSITEAIRLYLPTPIQGSGFISWVVNFLLLISFYVLTNWTFVILIGIIAFPFNDMISRRIEKKLVQNGDLLDRKNTFKEMISSLGKTFTNEIKKFFIIIFLATFALLSYYIPPISFVGIFLSAMLFAIQYLDYSWSRHDILWKSCLSDLFKNTIPYGISGLAFLAMVSIPLVVSFIPTFASAYYTILWLHRQNKI